MKHRSGIVGGIILVLLGVFFLAKQLVPEYFQFLDWTVVIIGLGVLFFLWAVIAGTGGLAVPGAILTGIGAIFFYQNQTGNWESWSFVWALIPAFIGVGIIIGGIIDRKFERAFGDGLTLIIISGIFFFAFGSFFGLQHDLLQYWPVLLILLGLISIVRVAFSGKKQNV